VNCDLCIRFCALFIWTYWVYYICPQDFLQNALGIYALHTFSNLTIFMLDFVHCVVGLCALEYMGKVILCDFSRSYVIRVG
jgi:hypothetical protein